LTVHCPCAEGGIEKQGVRVGTWGGEIRREFEPQPGDIVALERALGFERLRQHRLGPAAQATRHPALIVMGLIAHTCVEATVQYAAELGYDVTMVKDATTSYSDEHVHAALDTNIPNYASAIVTADEVVEAISAGAVS